MCNTDNKYMLTESDRLKEEIKRLEFIIKTKDVAIADMQKRLDILRYEAIRQAGGEVK